jgi:hypothetical protein
MAARPDHIGPENASRSFLAGSNVNGFHRYPTDVMVTHKLTFVTEFNWVRDD